MAGDVERVMKFLGVAIKGCAGCAVAAGLLLVAIAMAGNLLR